MNAIQDTLKLSGLLFLLPGTLMVLMPIEIVVFLSSSQSIPKIAVLVAGIGMNLTGLLLLHLAKQAKISQIKQKLVLFLHAFWVMLIVSGLFMSAWVTTINGITIMGLWLILAGWLGWQLLRTK